MTRREEVKEMEKDDGKGRGKRQEGGRMCTCTNNKSITTTSSSSSSDNSSGNSGNSSIDSGSNKSRRSSMKGSKVNEGEREIKKGGTVTLLLVKLVVLLLLDGLARVHGSR